MEKWFKDLQSTLDRLIGDIDITNFNNQLDVANPDEKVIIQVTDTYTKKLLPLSVHYIKLAKSMTAISLTDIESYRENSEKIETLFYKSRQIARLFWDIIEESSKAKDITIKRDFIIVERQPKQENSATIIWLTGNSLS